MLRLFVCVWVPKELIKGIEDLQKKILENGIKAKPVEKENFHVTITFLGDVNEGDMSEIKMKLDDCLKDMNEFHVNITELRIIPNDRQAKVLGVNVKSDEMRELIRIVGKNIGGSFHEEQKMTLCRVKSITNKDLFRRFVEENRNVNIGSFHVKNVALVKSVLTSRGPKYETIHKTKLKKNE